MIVKNILIHTFLPVVRVSKCGQGRLSSVTGRSQERSAGVLLQAELRSGGGCTVCTRPGHAQNIPVNDRNNNKTQDMATKQCYYSLSEHSKLVLDLNKQLKIVNCYF